MRKPSFFLCASFLGAALLCVGGDSYSAEKRLPTSMEEITLSFAETVRKSAPSVVTVYARRVVKRGTPLWRNPFFDNFFKGFPRGFGIPRERIERALGSGVILGADGIIVTNHHVVRDSDALTVTLNDRREFQAELILADEASDLAVLKIETPNETLPVLPFKDSDEIETGDLVLAIGNPFGVGQTVTNGIISAPARARPGISSIGFFLQTDAAINVGNSGGALVTLDGKLAGINTAIYSRGGGSVGIGFAIPANLVRRVVEAAERGEPLRRLWIGATFQSLTPEMAEAIGVTPYGVLIRTLYKDGPAAKAGLRVGDVIRRFGRHEVADIFALRYRIETAREGSLARIAYVRDGRRRQARVRIAQPPETTPREETALTGRHLLNGVTVANLSPALAAALNMDFGKRGVVVLSAGERGGQRFVREGDIIREAAGVSIKDVSALTSLFGSSNPPRRLTLERGGRRIVVAVR